jgi:hypothetical protein
MLVDLRVGLSGILSTVISFNFWFTYIQATLFLPNPKGRDYGIEPGANLIYRHFSLICGAYENI